VATLRVGIVGLGRVAQIAHLPVLRSLRQLYEVIAVSDVSTELRSRVGDEYAISRRYSTVYDLLEEEEIDVLFVLTPDETHSEITVAALEAGVHVFVEKPMCLCIREANDILAAQKRSGKRVMVGYMRRYASAFVEAKNLLSTYSSVNYARARGIIGENRLVTDQTAAFVSADLPSETLAESRKRRRNLILEAVGERDLPDRYVRAYRELCGLGCHDLSALRELLGPPRGVVAARTWNDGRFITVLLDYGDFVASYEGGTDAQLRFDAHIEV
jgi:predicted dehydrogenase